MFLLFLCLGTVHVNAQVRIGGNAAPNGAAVLDLNATDAATGTKGLALPRVRLDSATVQITPGVANLNGMMVYNTTATLGAGIYFWSGSAWVRANLPPTSASDSGNVLKFNGVSWVSRPLWFPLGTKDTLSLKSVQPTVSLTNILDTIFTPKIAVAAAQVYSIYVPALTENDFCFSTRIGASIYVGANMLHIQVNTTWPTTYYARVRCFRPTPL